MQTVKFSLIFYLKISARYSASYCLALVNGDRLNNEQNGFITHYELNNGPIFLSKKSGYISLCVNVPLPFP